MRGLVVATLLLACAAGCGGRRGGRPSSDAGGSPPDATALPDGGGPADGAPPPGDAGLPAGDAGPGRDAGGEGRDGGVDAGPPPLPLCWIGCAADIDCDSSSPAYDRDNYRCVSGACRWQGCNADTECAATFGDARWVCRDLGGLASCVQSCATASDCGSGTPAFDADNYSCAAGTCRYDGCNTDTECRSTFGSSAYVCAAVTPPDTGLPIPAADHNCVLGCSSAADCSTGSAAFDADNYACVSGSCRYEGCNDDAECRASFMSTGYVCRAL